MTEETIAESTKSSNSNSKTKLIVLIVLVIVAVILGIPAYQSYQQLNRAIAIFQAGDECIHNNDLAGAKAKFEECITIFPEMRGAYEELAAITYFDEHDAEGAIKIYERAISAIPNNADLYLSFARLYFSMQNYEKARELAQKAVDFGKNDQIYAKHLDLFDRLCKDPELRNRHQEVINKYGDRATDIPGAHHHTDVLSPEEMNKNDQAQAPADQAQAPADQAQAPADQAQAPADQAQAPADQAQAPADQAQAPADQAHDHEHAH